MGIGVAQQSRSTQSPRPLSAVQTAIKAAERDYAPFRIKRCIHYWYSAPVTSQLKQSLVGGQPLSAELGMQAVQGRQKWGGVPLATGPTGAALAAPLRPAASPVAPALAGRRAACARHVLGRAQQEEGTTSTTTSAASTNNPPQQEQEQEEEEVPQKLTTW